VVIPPDGTRFALRVDKTHSEFDALLKKQHVERWAFVTAYNPRSAQLADEANRSRMAVLREELTGRGYLLWDGEGIGDSGDWPPELSFLILGIKLPEAMEVATHHGQNAFLYGELSQPARLVRTSLAP
jgi:hypothetical protein